MGSQKVSFLCLSALAWFMMAKATLVGRRKATSCHPHWLETTGCFHGLPAADSISRNSSGKMDKILVIVPHSVAVLSRFENKKYSSQAWWNGLVIVRQRQNDWKVMVYLGYRGSSGPAWEIKRRKEAYRYCLSAEYLPSMHETPALTSSTTEIKWTEQEITFLLWCHW